MWGISGSTARSGVVDVVVRVRIGPRSNVILIRMGQRLLLVSESAAGLSMLANIHDPQEVDALLTTVTRSKSKSVTTGFATLLNRFNREYHEVERAGTEGRDNAEFHVDRARDQLTGLLARVRNTFSGGGQ